MASLDEFKSSTQEVTEKITEVERIESSNWKMEEVDIKEINVNDIDRVWGEIESASKQNTETISDLSEFIENTVNKKEKLEGVNEDGDFQEEIKEQDQKLKDAESYLIDLSNNQNELVIATNALQNIVQYNFSSDIQDNTKSVTAMIWKASSTLWVNFTQDDLEWKSVTLWYVNEKTWASAKVRSSKDNEWNERFEAEVGRMSDNKKDKMDNFLKKKG